MLDDEGVSPSVSVSLSMSMSGFTDSFKLTKFDRDLLVEKKSKEAIVKVHLESTSKVAKHYSTLFSGLTKNHPNNAMVI